MCPPMGRWGFPKTLSAPRGGVFARRKRAVPNVPTYGEMGFPNIHVGSWVGFFAPAKTPDTIVVKLNAQINQIMKDPELLQTLQKIGFDPITKPPAETAEYFKNEVAT